METDLQETLLGCRIFCVGKRTAFPAGIAPVQQQLLPTAGSNEEMAIPVETYTFIRIYIGK